MDFPVFGSLELEAKGETLRGRRMGEMRYILTESVMCAASGV